MHSDPVSINVDGQVLAGTVAVPKTGVPGVLFVHGWTGSQETDLQRSQEIASLGCVCLTFDLRGHAGTESIRQSVTPADNMNDVLAAYDTLAAHPIIDKSSIAVIGSSYGAYLAALLTEERPVRWLSLRVPALYRDDDWTIPKGRHDRLALAHYRQERVDPADNRALKACTRFEGDVLLVESEVDDRIPHATVANYLASFRRARSLTYRIVEGADHALSDPAARQVFTGMLVRWIREMVVGAR